MNISLLWQSSSDRKFNMYDGRNLSFAFALCCATAQIIGVVSKFLRSKNVPQRDALHAKMTPMERMKAHIRWCGGSTIYAYLVAQFLGVLGLLGLFLTTLFQRHERRRWLEFYENPEALVVVTLCYCASLCLLTLCSKTLSQSASFYKTVVLLSLTSTYLHRDIWPLATTYLTPKDINEGWIIWAKLTVLVGVGILIPLFKPKNGRSMNATDGEVPERKASIFSKMMFTFMDPLVSLGSRVPRLRGDQMPPLAHQDYAEYQTKEAFTHMSVFNGAKKRHLTYGLFAHFGKDYTILSGIVVLMTLTGFAAPIGINRLLVTIEPDGQDTGIRPWVWVLWMFLGPFAHSLTTQQYFNITRRTQVRIELLITELVFEHGLRIRLKGSSSSTSTASKTQQTDDSASPTTPEVPTDEKKSLENVIGMINTLVTSDIANITGGRDFLLLFIYVPLQLALCMLFLFRFLGWSAFIGLATILVLFPVPGYITKLLGDVQVDRMKKTDARVESVMEAINVARMIKLFGWETKMMRRLQDKRNDELSMLKKYKVLDTLNGLLSFLLPTITMLVTVAAYTLLFKQELKASTIFPSMTLFGMLREQMQRIAWDVSMIVQARVSLNRVNDFLYQSELLDSHLEASGITEQHTANLVPEERSADIGFNNASFTWNLDDATTRPNTPSHRSFKLQFEGQVLFKKGAINLITGPTGAGKTSILMALLGEMHFAQGRSGSWFNLPRSGGIGYVAQESWVQNDTIKNNILFGSPYDGERYRKVLMQCALEQDLRMFDAGDETEVGERGLTLSGGQKARITLARALYSRADILLLDDILAALDAHTAQWIVDQCLRGDLIKGRTVLLVTHNLTLLEPLAELVVSISSDGKISSRENIITYAHVMSVPAPSSNPPGLAETDVVAAEVSDGKLIMAEEVAQGHITWTAMKLLFKGFGGNHPFLFFVACVLGLAVTDLSSTFQMWFLGYWATQYETNAPGDVKSGRYLAIYGALMAVAFTIYSATHLYFTFGSVRASRKIHESLIGSIFTSTLRWLDETPTGRIISRCTQDINAIDGPIPQLLMWCLEPVIAVFTKLSVIILFSPAFLAPGLGIALLGFYVGHIYLKTQLSVKREMSNAKSPVLSHFSAAMHGLTSIRAYGAEQAFITDSMGRINTYTRIARTTYNLHRWVSIRIEGLGAVFTAGLAAYLVYGRPISASDTGFSLTIAAEFSTCILWVVMIFNDFEVESNSLERIQGYLDIEHEPEATRKGTPPAAWPTSGELTVENLSARYSKNGRKVLHGISFHVKSGERIGVVGRTGSGKSSLALALLRCILTEGTVYYDGVATQQINLDALRSNITIIPQVPELLSGTLRQNIDPFGQNDDATLNDALKSAGLFSVQDGAGDARLTLDSVVTGGGSNLSVGQRQIIALARAMVRGSKVLILDEATSSIDYKTDAVIQHTLRHELPKDVTVLTIAHRVHNVMDADKLLVLEDGRLVEYDSPKNLLEIETGVFRRLVERSGHEEALHTLAEKHST